MRSVLRLSAIAATFSAIAITSACEGGLPQAQQGTPNTDASSKPTDQPALTMIGPSQIALKVGQQHPLRVHYGQDGKNLASEGIQFRFLDPRCDARISSPTGVTDQAGFAQISLASGAVPCGFRLEARTPTGMTAVWSISVGQGGATTPGTPGISGVFELTSNFDLAANFQGSGFASVLNMLEEVSDNPDDPGKFIVDLIIDELAGDTSNLALVTVVQFAKVLLYYEVNELLASSAGPFVAAMKQVTADLSTIARRFSVTSAMTFASPQTIDQNLVADHRLKSIAWNLRGKRVEYSFLQLGMADPVVSGVALSPGPLADGNVLVSEQTFSLKYGSFLLVGLNNLIIPNINSKANDLTSLISSYLDCKSVAETLVDSTGVGGEVLWEATCVAAIAGFAGSVEQALIAMDDDDPSQLKIKGQARLLPLSSGGTTPWVGEIDRGLWSGTLNLAGAVTTFAGGNNNFTGKRKP
jgi:hypothetical protein